MKKFRFFVLPLFLACFFSSCEKESKPSDCLTTNDVSLEQFSVLLSKAVYSEPDLREFIKSEALAKKDYDSDVFYPFVKDEIVDGTRTFEEILKQYDDGNVLQTVLARHPLLTIFVPDWSWIKDDCFSVENWDCSLPDVGVSALQDDKEHKVYWNGEYAFTMQKREFSTAPILIVKDNDRLVEDERTKCPGKTGYRFFTDDLINLSANNSVSTKTTSKYYTYDLPYSVATDSVSTSLLTYRTASAYSVCANSSQVYQRDHIYYGMTSQTNTGSVNPNYYETLYRFKLSPNENGLTDDPIGEDTGNDFKTTDYYYEASWGTATKLTEAQLAAKSWGTGAADLRIRIYGGAEVLTKNVTVSFSDAFYVKKVELRENYNWLGALKSRTYYLSIGTSGTNDEWLEPKWITANLQLFYWDLSVYPTAYYVEFEEYDKATKKTTSVSKTYSFATNFNASLGAEGTVNGTTLKVGFGFGATSTKSRTYTTTIETTESSDNLGSFVVQYKDKIVLGQKNSKFRIKTYSTGSVDAQIIAFYE